MLELFTVFFKYLLGFMAEDHAYVRLKAKLIKNSLIPFLRALQKRYELSDKNLRAG